MNLMKLREAVLKNTARPGNDESKGVAEKPLRTSQYWEGDAEMGVILFIGIAMSYGFTPFELTQFVAVEREQVLFKNEHYNKMMKDDGLGGARMRVKTELIKNYLWFYDRTFKK
jgi:hypothetical protein